MSAQHTPGPWETRDGYLVGANGKRVLFSGHLGLCLAPLPASNPDDAVVRAAPELLEALEELHLKAVVGTDEERHAALDKAWAAISKARGA